MAKLPAALKLKINKSGPDFLTVYPKSVLVLLAQVSIYVAGAH